MRNLFFVHLKRCIFRWETYAATLWNLFLGALSLYLAKSLYDNPNSSDSVNAQTGFLYFFVFFLALSVFGTITAVIFSETSNLKEGALRLCCIAGFTKRQVFFSRYLIMGLFGAVEGAFFVVPVTVFGIAGAYTAGLLISVLLLYAAVACLSVMVFLLSERPTASGVLLICCLIGLTAGAVHYANTLDIRQYEYAQNQVNEIEKIPNQFYVSTPKRDILEYALRLNPVQSVEEYVIWYLSRSEISFQRLEALAEKMPTAKLQFEDLKAEYTRHYQRMNVLPVYQFGVLTALCVIGTIVFTKRNLK